MIGVTGLGFFGLTLFSGAVEPLAALAGTTPLMLAVLVGAVQNILSKSSKYSLFDPCKEMAYIPLDQESKTKGKAAIDVVGNPLGKSGGAMIQQVLIFAVGSLAASTPVSVGDLCKTRSFQSLSDHSCVFASFQLLIVPCCDSFRNDLRVVQGGQFIVWAV